MRKKTNLYLLLCIFIILSAFLITGNFSFSVVSKERQYILHSEKNQQNNPPRPSTIIRDNKTPKATSLPENLGIIGNMGIGLTGVPNGPVSGAEVEPDKDMPHLTVLKSSENKIMIFNALSNKEILLTQLGQKPWGTWNIDGWYIASDISEHPQSIHLIAGGGSDWEYVFRVAKVPGTDYEFSGGNHGNELLKNIKLVDGSTGQTLEAETGKSINMCSVKIIEATSLLYSKNNPETKYADAVRTYTITPAKIVLETHFEFTSDIFMGTSFVCMLPSSKDYGRYIRFNDSGNVYSTSRNGKNLSGIDDDNYLGQEKTTSVELWGDLNQDYKFRVWIDNDQMIDYFNNRLKVFYWDAGPYTNKLYFSKYDNKEHRKIEKGTVWENSAGWEFTIQSSKS